jgi:hypothetical protein
MGITEGSSKWHLCEARKTLKKELSHIYPFQKRDYAA